MTMTRKLSLTLTRAAALAAAPLAPAHAWGEKEQNALLGIAALGTIGALAFGLGLSEAVFGRKHG